MTRSKQIPKMARDFQQQAGVTFADNSPEFLLAAARTYGEIVQFQFGPFKFVLISNPDMVREVLVTQAKKFPKANRDVRLLSRVLGEGLVTTNGNQHKRQRKLAQPAFHHRRIAGYGETISDYADRVSAGLEPGDTINMAETMEALTMYIVSKTLFDVDMEEMIDRSDEIGHAIDTLQTLADKNFDKLFNFPMWVPTPDNIRNRRARKVLDSTITQIMKDRRAAGAGGQPIDTGDLLSMLMMAEDDEGNPMSDDEIRDQLLTLFIAGHETTSNALLWTWYLLSQHPEVEEKLHNEVDEVLQGQLPTMEDLKRLPYTDMVLKESMRVLPPVWMLNARQAAEDVEIFGYTIPQGHQVFISPYVMHHLEEHFPEPELFDPDRFHPEVSGEINKFTWMPFGAGGRICIGNSFAMMEAQLILATFAQKFKFELDPAEFVRLQARITLTNRDGLAMKVVERNPNLQALGDENLETRVPTVTP